MLTPGTISVPQSQWQPVGQRDAFIHEHRLLVELASSPPDWFNRLKATPGVQNTGFLDPKDYLCRTIIYGTPPPGVAVPLNATQAGTYARITFSSPLNTYDAALYTVSNLGLRLVDPCYEQALLHRGKPLWHPMGQEQSFTSTPSLIVATSKEVTSSLWKEHLRALPGIVSIASPYTATCKYLSFGQTNGNMRY